MRWLGWLLIQIALAGADWTQFRGPNGSGVSPSKGLPEHFDPQKNVVWRTALPLGPFNNVNGHGSSPILADGKLVLICDQDTGSYLLAVDAPSGRVLWKTMRPEYTRGYATPAIYRPKSGPAELIVPGSFEVASYNIETGEKLWWGRGI